MSSENESIATPSSEKFFDGKISIREFLVDFFGALMPGVFFLIFLIFSFILPLIVALHNIFCLFKKCEYNIIDIAFTKGEFFIPNPSLVSDIVLFLLFLAFGYIIGTLFYRLDPRTPDYRSFLKIASSFTDEDDLKKWVVRVKKNADARKEMDRMFIVSGRRFFGKWIPLSCKRSENKLTPPDQLVDSPSEISVNCISEKEVQFPYNNLRGYLEARGLKELANKISWGIDEKTNGSNVQPGALAHARSKTFINTLKIRLQFYFPDQCSTIIKNEAHIRLSSSMWYVSSTLIKYSRFGIIAIVFASIVLLVFSNSIFIQNIVELLLVLFISVLTWFLAFRLKNGIEKFIHYQRVREIFYVLETALTASKNMAREGKELIFDGLDIPKE